jgi:tetrapyrrole methylase family protein/MazG family protein
MPESIADLIRDLEGRHGAVLRAGVQVLAPRAVLARPFDPAMALLITADAAEATPLDVDGATFEPDVLPGRHAHGRDVVALLRRLYPPEHPVLGVDGADRSLADLDADAFGRSAVLLPALDAERSLASPHGLPWLVARLRAPDGCPWDREQDHRSLRTYLLEETYEVYDALEHGSTPQLAEELGDLLLQVVLHAQYAAEAGVFDLADVYGSIMAKIIRRHPHVFGDVRADTAREVIANWEAIKTTERAARSAGAGAAGGPVAARAAEDAVTEDTSIAMPAAFAGLSRTLPALAFANEMQERAAGLGYDWEHLDGVLDKIVEEAAELRDADPDARYEEFGDLLFVVVNLARKLGVDPEAALRAASRKFAGRFGRVERLAEADGVRLRDLDAGELDRLWQRAKAEEREASTARARSRDGAARTPA